MSDWEFKYPVGTRVVVNELGHLEGLGKEGREGVVKKIHVVPPGTDFYEQATVRFDNGKKKKVYDDQVDKVEDDDTLKLAPAGTEPPGVAEYDSGSGTFQVVLGVAAGEVMGAGSDKTVEPQWIAATATVSGDSLFIDVDESDPISPPHYQFPGGAEVRHISEWLTANAAQALQYIARSSRIDGNNKGDAREDIAKAIKFLEFELERLEVEQ